MNNCRLTRLLKLFIALLVSFFVSVAQAAEILINSDVIDQAMDVISQKYQSSAEAQEEITRLQNEASSTFEEFKRAEFDKLNLEFIVRVMLLGIKVVLRIETLQLSFV